ncbi:hypothetical protein Taro_029651 [Colocasia esculenta]|uniref:Uncharacterized protein n=1 Tax=Colocasia esculenta TaxID=4460 RepID=A0A843VJG6_COLES|nr:hypothetical protein [Colocasia esculenta]
MRSTGRANPLLAAAPAPSRTHARGHLCRPVRESSSPLTSPSSLRPRDPNWLHQPPPGSLVDSATRLHQHFFGLLRRLSSQTRTPENLARFLEEIAFAKFGRLRTLRLNGVQLPALPTSIQNLKLLRLLDLTAAPIEVLTESVGNLYNLQRPRRRAPPAKRRRRLLLGRAVSFSPFFRSLSRHLLRPPSPTASAPKGEAPARAPPALKRSKFTPRRAEPFLLESSSNDESDLDEEEQDDMIEEILPVDFELFDPKPDDFHGVKLLLHSYLGDRQWDLSGFVDLILEQTTVGTVVKLNKTEYEEDEEDDYDDARRGADDDKGPFASHQCIKELKEYLIEICHENGVKNKLLPMLEGNQAHSTRLLVCERFVNFPHQPMQHLYDALFDEVSWATEDEATHGIRDSFRFKLYLLLTRIFMKDVDIAKGGAKVRLGKNKKSSYDSKGRNFDGDEPIVHQGRRRSFS